MKNLWFICVLGTLSYPTSAENMFEETNDQIELIYQPIGSAFLTYAEYRICYYHDIKDYFDELANIRSQVNNAKAACLRELAKYKNDTHICTETMAELDKRVVELEETNEKIKSFNSHRKRRAPLELIGTLANSLFGILSREDADRYNGMIEEAKSSSRKNLNLISEHTSILEAAINVFNQTSIEVRDKLNRLEQMFGQPLNRAESNERWWNIQINSVTSLAIVSLDRYEKTAIHILYIVANLIEGNLFPFITKAQIAQNLEDINKNLTKEEALPINPFTDSPYRLLHVSSLHSTLTRDRILTELTIPIIQTKQYQVYKIIPVPFGKGKMSIITPTTDMFLTDRTHEEFIPITEDEYRDCRYLEQDKMICKQYEQVLIDGEKGCELSLLNNPHSKTIPPNCKIQQVPTKNYFIHLHTLNKYYCLIRQPLTIQIICNETTEYLKLERDGFLKIQQGCQIKSDEFILRSHRTNKIFNRESKYIFSKRNLTEETAANIKENELQNEFIKTPSKDYSKIIERLESLKREEEQERNREWWTDLRRENSIKSYGISLGMISLVGIGALAVMIIIRKIKTLFRREQPQLRRRTTA